MKHKKITEGRRCLRRSWVGKTTKKDDNNRGHRANIRTLGKRRETRAVRRRAF